MSEMKEVRIQDDSDFWRSLVGTNAGNYQLVGFLGSGSFGSVYRAMPVMDNEVFGASVAVKILIVEGDDGGYAMREVRRIAEVSHESIVRMVGVPEKLTLAWKGYNHQAIFFAMELAESSLEDVLGKEAITKAEIIDLARSLALGLAYLHDEKKIVHRDIRPPNVLRVGGKWKLSDFSIAHPFSSGPYEALIKPPDIVPPECSYENEPVPAWDMWALGIVLAWASVGTHPMAGLNARDRAKALHGPQPLPLPPLPPAVERIVRGCLEKDPEQRWTARLVTEEAQPQSSEATPFHVTPPTGLRRRDLIVAGVSGLAGAGITAAVAAVVQSSPNSPVPWRVHSGKWMRPGCVFQDAEIAPRMVVLPRGGFWMGSEEREPGRDPTEGPRHQVRIGYDLALGECAVSFSEWDAYAADGGRRPYDEGWGRGDRPVINVSWTDAKKYLDWLNGRLGLSGRSDRYRLPSEAEWEYGCRGGTDTPFWWGGTITSSQANYNGSYAYYNGESTGEFRQRTVPVRNFSPNPYGLYQVHGNVREACEDAWQGGNYDGAPSDGSAHTVDDNTMNHVARGGSWNSSPWNLRSASRDMRTYLPGPEVGFRVAITLRDRFRAPNSG
ncbi:bifunctional serine/threonine-protein kinase/formylglycine-generating enzyme family protein [Azospirillum sp. HJ39]|uniref:bifunctional serine/threonine-protein kinase/formylglycine-generating enzyme family protein n=1 Tax=Azospirillum sp. HJ39 TaxID=3159496 RepID=UPI0035568F99